MKPRFEPDSSQSGANDTFSPSLIDPEAYDASEQRFAASLEPIPHGRTPRFVVEEESDALPETPAESQEHEDERVGTEIHEETGPLSTSAGNAEAPDPESWRREVAARLHHYRARRRPREPRYPSLQLKFESEPASSPSVDLSVEDTNDFDSRPSLTALPRIMKTPPPSTVPRIRLAEPVESSRPLFAVANEATAKVIEFASYSAPVRPLDELAEPVLSRPRIIEAPELVPPPPALGGISIEAVEEPPNERRPGFEIPLQAAPMGRRIAAAGIDAVLVLVAVAAFAYISFRIMGEPASITKLAGTAFALTGAFWCAYEYLLLVYSGTTPGLRLARLELQRFDGDPAPRRLRQWRVLASVLSGVSLGLGYAWCLLDEDQLCWHDRITRTYMAPGR